jgi:hypothetical protein
MFRLLIVVALLIAGVIAAGAYLDFNPVCFVFAILGFGIFMVGRIGGPALPEGRSTHWGSGHGIYFDSCDVWVTGQNADDERHFRDGMPR